MKNLECQSMKKRAALHWEKQGRNRLDGWENSRFSVMEDLKSCFPGGLSSIYHPCVRTPNEGSCRYGQNQLRITLFSILITVFCLCRFASGSDYKVNDEVGSVEALGSGSLNGSRRSLDGILQEYAFKALTKPRTGIIYDAPVPSNLSGMKVEAVRLKSGSLWNRGMLYKEFQIPSGVLEQVYVQRLVLVYQNLGNWSSLYYNKPGFDLVAPVLGLLAYDASNLSAINPQELQIVATKQPISIRFPEVREGLTPICISFYSNGSVSLSNASSSNVCSTNYQGHFSLIVESPVPPPTPSPAPVPEYTSPAQPPLVPVRAKKKISNTWKIVLGIALGSVALIASLILLGFGMVKYNQTSKIARMEHQADQGESLQTTSVGSSRAPAAGGTRTQPMLENEYIA
jgi:hypothetical protein